MFLAAPEHMVSEHSGHVSEGSDHHSTLLPLHSAQKSTLQANIIEESLG